MILVLILLLPLLSAGVILALKDRRSATRFALLAGTSEIISLAVAVWRIHAAGSLDVAGYLRADSLTAFFLVNIGLVFFVVLLYSVGYIRHVPIGRFSSPRWFYFLLFLFLFTMMGVYLASNLGLLWIMMEGTTLASALLVAFYNTEGAIEAGWKYLIVCTVGLAFALFGTIVFYIAAVRAGMTPQAALQWPALLRAAASLGGSHTLIKLAFVFLVVGYGTKIGLVPMHSWLPDAHAEAPSPVSAMLSAGLLNCAAYALMRYHAIVSRSLGPQFGNHLLLFFGAISLVVAALLMIVQKDLKRLLAYSSVEHMGIIATGLGLGGFFGLYGALLHTLNHSLAKSLLFFSAGRVRESVGTSRLSALNALGRRLPWVSAGLVIGLVAILGLPPFGLFISEFAILREAFGQSHWLPGLLLLAALIVVFGAMTHHFLKVLMGSPANEEIRPAATEGSRSEFAAMGICAAALLVFGVTIPGPFMHLLKAAMAVLQ